MNASTTTPSTSGPALDRVPLTGAGARDGQTLTANVSSELMKNQLPGTAIEATQDADVVQDAAGQPMLLTIGSDRHLRLLATTPGATATGFTETDLTSGFSGYDGIGDFDVTQDNQGRITLAFGLTVHGQTGTDLFVASMLPNDPTAPEWSALATHASKIAGLDSAFALRQIRMGTTDDGSPAFGIAVGDLGGQEVYYQFADPTSPAQRYELPENVPTGAAMQLSIGYVAGVRGVWFLYSNGPTQTLECTTVATASDKSVTIDYSPGQGKVPSSLQYTCLATPASPATKGTSLASDVYVGTSTGVVLFPGAHAGQFMQVTDQIADVHQLDVERHGDDISVWALCSPNRLYYIYGSKTDQGYTFNTPILFSASAIHVAPVRSATRNANELFVLEQDSSVTHHWQDPGSTLWQRRTISVPKTNVIVDMDTFTTRIALEDAKGGPLAGVQLQLTTSDWQYVTANGLLYSLDLDTPAAITTDELGSITLIAHTTNVAPPILHVTSESFAETLNVYPNGRIQQGLAAIKSGADLQHATTADGDPVLPGTTDSATADGVAQVLAKLTAAGASLAPGLGAGDHVYVTATSNVKHTGALTAAGVPSGPALAMQVKGGIWQPHPDPVALLQASSSLETLDTVVGDALQWLETAFEDAVTYVKDGIVYLEEGISFVVQVVEDGVQLVLTVLDKVLRIELKILGAVFKAVSWLLKLVGIDLPAILKWLGHELGWDAIWDAHKIIAAIMRNGLDYGVAQVTNYLEEARAAIHEALQSLKGDLANLVLPDASSLAPIQSSSAMLPAAHTAPATYCFYQVRYGDLLSSAPAGEWTGDPATDLWTTIETAVETFVADFETDVEDLAEIARGPAGRLDDVRKLANDLADTAIDPMEKIADGAITVIEDCLTSLKEGLEEPADLPIFSTLYESVTSALGEQEELTFINATALLVAIPFVEISRIAGHGSPFDGGTHGLDSPDLFPKLVAGLSSTPQTHEAARAAMSMAMAAGGSDADSNSAAPEVPALVKAYADFGALIASVSGVLKSLMDMLDAGALAGKGEKEPLLQPKPLWKLASASGKVSNGLTVLRQATTFPMRDPKASDAGYGLLVTGWAIGFTDFVTPWIGKPQVSGGITVVASGITTVLLMIADGLDAASWLAWVVDISSGAVWMGVGSCEAAEQPDYGFLFCGGAFVVSLVSFVRYFEATEEMVVHSVNIA